MFRWLTGCSVCLFVHRCNECTRYNKYYTHSLTHTHSYRSMFIVFDFLRPIHFYGTWNRTTLKVFVYSTLVLLTRAKFKHKPTAGEWEVIWGNSMVHSYPFVTLNISTLLVHSKYVYEKRNNKKRKRIHLIANQNIRLYKHKCNNNSKSNAS